MVRLLEKNYILPYGMDTCRSFIYLLAIFDFPFGGKLLPLFLMVMIVIGVMVSVRLSRPFTLHGYGQRTNVTTALQ